MKLIKILVTMTLLNAIVVMGIVYYGSKQIVVSPALSPSIQPSPTASTNVVPIAKPSVAPTPKPVTGCVIKIDGVSYEITSLRQTHSGGDVFTCGTDMSAIFWGKHNARILQIMQQYKI